MNRCKKISVLILFAIITIVFFSYFTVKKSIPINELGVRTDFLMLRTFSILSINLSFLILMFLVDINYYKKLLGAIMVIGLVTYILSILGRNCPFIGVNGNFFELIVFLTYAIVPPGIIVNILYYIKNYSNQYIDKTYGDSWHIHESFLGLLLISGGALLIISNLYMNKFQVFQKQLSFILSITGVFLYFFLFLGGFLIARDWNDVIQLKFIEKKSNAHHLRKKGESLSCEVFNQISKEDLEFFESPRYQIYPIGVILTTISLSFIIYNQSLLPSEIFFISPQMVTIMGYIGGFIAGFILGVDWLRLFGKFYPQVNRNLDKIIEILKR